MLQKKKKQQNQTTKKDHPTQLIYFPLTYQKKEKYIMWMREYQNISFKIIWQNDFFLFKSKTKQKQTTTNKKNLNWSTILTALASKLACLQTWDLILLFYVSLN